MSSSALRLMERERPLVVFKLRYMSAHAQDGSTENIMRFNAGHASDILNGGGKRIEEQRDLPMDSKLIEESYKWLRGEPNRVENQDKLLKCISEKDQKFSSLSITA
ncbi:hypothetical protein KM043_007870 [Ampulex compressa]|nr:hypothetical protein KM043_007870 [Ampulex compressa]